MPLGGACFPALSELADGIFLFALGRGAQFGLAPLGQSGTYWFATKNRPPRERSAAEDEKAAVLASFRAWPPPIGEVIEATPAQAILRSDVSDRPPIRRWGAGRVTLLGDAAHPMTPNLGQGACQAIEDAAVLACTLRGAGDAAGALRSYEAVRRGRTAMVTRLSFYAGVLFQAERPPACAARDLLIRVTPGPLARWQVGWLLRGIPRSHGPREGSLS